MGAEVVIVKPDKYEYFTLGKGFKTFIDNDIFSHDFNSPRKVNELTAEDIYNNLLSRQKSDWSDDVDTETYFREIAQKILEWAEEDSVCVSTDDYLYEISAYDHDSPGYDETGTRYIE